MPEQMVLPLGVDDLEHDHPFEFTHPDGPRMLLLLFVDGAQRSSSDRLPELIVDDRVSQSIP